MTTICTNMKNIVTTLTNNKWICTIKEEIKHYILEIEITNLFI